MESKDIQKLPELLLSLGYTKEEILKMMQTTPTLLRYTPETKKFLMN